MIMIVLMIMSGGSSDLAAIASYAESEHVPAEENTAELASVDSDAGVSFDSGDAQDQNNQELQEDGESPDSSAQGDASEDADAASEDSSKASLDEDPKDGSSEQENPEPEISGDETVYEEEIPEEAGIELREVKAELVPEVLYDSKEDWKEDKKSVPYRKLVKFWKSLTGRKIESETSEQGFDVTVKGMLPEEIKAECRYITMDEGSTFTEQGAAGLEIVLYDKDGNLYVPEEPVEVTIGGREVKSSIDDEEPVLIYSYQNNKERKERYEKKLEKPVYAADVTVYKSQGTDDKLLAYEPYDL